MTDNTQPEALRLAEILEGDYCPDWFYEQGVDEVAAELRRQHTRIAELESELEAIGAGGVSGPLVGRAAPPTAQAEGWSMGERPRICTDDNWTRGYRSEEEDGPRAIRWATRMLERMFSPDWTKWHYTEGDGSQTACRQPVQLFTLDGSPQERDVNYVNCKRCLKAMAAIQKDPS